MIKTYFLIAWRNLVKNMVSSIINIGGLSVGLATGIIILLVIANEVSYDKFHRNIKQIYLLMQNEHVNGTVITGRVTPGLLAASVRNEIPGIKYTARTSQEGQELLRFGDKSAYENGIYAEPDYFNMMSFHVLEGDPLAALQQPGSVVITERTAKKFFPRENALGKILMHNNANALKVGAVIADVPLNSSNQFDVVLPFRLYEQQNTWLMKWDDNRIYTWVQLNQNTQLAAINDKLKDLYIRKQDSKNVTLFAYPFADLRLRGSFRNGKSKGGAIEMVTLLGFIGGFVLLIACINFMNLATARSERRAREVGVRKVMGASRKLIIFQFLGEAILLSFIALVIGILLAELALPAFMRMANRTFNPDYSNWRIWALLLGLGTITGLISGSYPALYLSRFQPVKVLKGLAAEGNRGGILRKALVTFQFVISIFLVIATIVIFQQIKYIENRPLGYQAENLIDIPVRGDMPAKFGIAKNELSQITGVKSVSAGTDNMVRFGAAFNGLEWPGKSPDDDFYITVTSVSYDWVKTTGISLAEGRDFSPAFGADTSNCLINEAAAKRMNLKQPLIGTRLGTNTIIGVVKDFVFNNPSSAPAPLIVFLSKGNMSHFFVRINNDEKWKDCMVKIAATMKKINPNIPFEFRFTREEQQKSFEQIRSVGQMANIFGIMAIFISCLGLFGLSAFLAERRSKEVSIRKLLGASVASIWFSLSKDFLKPVALAFAVGAPPAGWVMQKMLLEMEYHTELKWWMFAGAGLLAFLIAVITISFNGIKAALVNPARNLKST